MFLTGHVPLKTHRPKVAMESVEDLPRDVAKERFRLVLPGRHSDPWTEPWQTSKSAFSVAAKEKVPVVPITLVNTGGVMRNGKEWMISAKLRH